MSSSSSSSFKTAAARTKYRQDLDKVESKLFVVLSRVYKAIQRDIGLGAPWDQILYIYKEKIDDIIRAAVTELYEISARRIVEQDIELPFF